jgi:hypothetical protein
VRSEKRKERRIESPWCPEGWPDWRGSFSMMEALCLKAGAEKRSLERDQVQKNSEIKKERAKQRKKTPYIMNIMGFSAFWTRLDKEATKKKKENDINTKMKTEIRRNQSIWKKFLERGPTPAGEEYLLTRVNHTDYQSGGHVTISRKKKNILQPVLLTSFSPCKRKLSNPELFNMESPSQKCKVNDLIGFWENKHTAKQT